MHLDGMTLRRWYEELFIRLFHADARPRTIESYRYTISAWEKHTPNPPVDRIDPLALANFRAAFPNKATAAMHCRQLNAMLTKLGPPGYRNRDALGLIANVPWLKPPSPQKRLPLIPHDEQIAAMVQLAPADLALFTVTAALTGSRQTAIRFLTPANIDIPGQFIRLPADTDKRNCERKKPVPKVVLKWWDRFGEQSSRWRVQRSSFARRWNYWTAHVGAAPLRPHGLKRWWAAQLIRSGATPWAVRYALDHAQRDVTGIHYLAPFDELAGLVDRVPLPPAFTEDLCQSRPLSIPPMTSGTRTWPDESSDQEDHNTEQATDEPNDS